LGKYPTFWANGLYWAKPLYSGSGGVIIVMVMLAELDGGGSSVALVFESPGRSKIKITARSEAKQRY